MWWWLSCGGGCHVVVIVMWWWFSCKIKHGNGDRCWLYRSCWWLSCGGGRHVVLIVIGTGCHVVVEVIGNDCPGSGWLLTVPLHGEGLWKNQSFKICWRHCNKSFFTTLKPSSVFKCRSEVYDFENHFVAYFYHNTCHVKRINRFFEKKLFWDTLMLMLVLLEQTSTRQIAVESSEKYHGRTD